METPEAPEMPETLVVMVGMGCFTMAAAAVRSEVLAGRRVMQAAALVVMAALVETQLVQAAVAAQE